MECKMSCVSVCKIAPSFVPRENSVVAPMPKSVRSLARSNVRSSSSRNDIKMMPIGVPKVAYRVPGSQSADWVDIYNRLYRERIIFIGSEIDDELANQIIGVMLYLDSEDQDKPIYLYINCPGGSVISGLAIYDCMQHIKSEVITINLGLAASMASFIHQLSWGKRYLRSCHLRLHAAHQERGYHHQPRPCRLHGFLHPRRRLEGQASRPPLLPHYDPSANGWCTRSSRRYQGRGCANHAHS
mmetsp:Transcript_41241/g.62514  ORF Transcript_41241/g.62514 Transcript_41241/m.62514 type:complete len:242 (+) Transcript_41241:208-933(+)